MYICQAVKYSGTACSTKNMNIQRNRSLHSADGGSSVCSDPVQPQKSLFLDT